MADTPVSPTHPLTISVRREAELPEQRSSTALRSAQHTLISKELNPSSYNLSNPLYTHHTTLQLPPQNIYLISPLQFPIQSAHAPSTSTSTPAPTDSTTTLPPQRQTTMADTNGGPNTPSFDLSSAAATQVRPGGAPARVFLNEKIVPYLLEGMKTVTRDQ